MSNYPETDLQVWGFLLLPVFCVLILACQMGTAFHDNMKKLQILGFYIVKRMIIQLKKEKVRCFQRSTCQTYSRLFWARNLEIYSKSKNVHVKIVSKAHAYISLCCTSNMCSSQVVFFHEPALPQDCESHDGFWMLMQVQAISAIYISMVCWVPNVPLKFCCQSGSKALCAPCFEGLFIIFI